MLHYARFGLVMTSRAPGRDPVGGPDADFRNEAGFREECRSANTLGMVGRWATHPNQITIAGQVFSLDPSRVVSARHVVSSYAEAAGSGSINVDGVMVGVATGRSQRNGILRKAELDGM